MTAPRKIIRTDRACKYCGATPITGYSFCSEPCRRYARRRAKGVRDIDVVKAERAAQKVERRTRTCEMCSAVFLMADPGSKARAGKVTPGRFCSRQCHVEHMAAASAIRQARARLIALLTIRAECTVCGVAFVKRSAASTRCSSECDAAFVRARSREMLMAADCRDRAPRPCGECGVEFAPVYGDKRRLYCSRACGRTAVRRGVRRAGRKYKERARHHGVEYEPVNVMAVFERDRWTCQVCGVKTPKKFRGTFVNQAPELDHRIPMAVGGGHLWGNVQCACRACNGRKGGTLVRGQLSLWADPRAA